MINGKSFLQLYYNKACTRELEKDLEGNYIYNSKNISTNSIMPLILNIFCKNNGSHTAYDVRLEIVSSILEIPTPKGLDKMYSNHVHNFPMSIYINNGDTENHTIVLRLHYDSI